MLAYIDDATSRLMHAAFVPSESTFDYLRETQRYVGAHGRPIAFYSDKHAIFRVNKTAAAGGDGMTQFGRALHELNIDIICANSPAAKGRIERSFGTLQDRLVKELRLAGISTIEAANAFLLSFLADHNRRFARAPFSASDAHREVQQNIVLEDVFAWKEQRTRDLQPDTPVRQDDLSAGAKRGHAPPRPPTRDGDRLSGRPSVDPPRRRRPALSSTYDKIRKVTQAAIVENKRLSEVLAYVAQRQQERDEKRSAKAPRRRGQPERHMFKY